MDTNQKIKKSILMDGIVCYLRDAKTFVKGSKPEIFATLTFILCANFIGANMYKNHVKNEKIEISAGIEQGKIVNNLITDYLSSKPVDFIYEEKFGNTHLEAKVLFQDFGQLTERKRAYLVKKTVVGEKIHHYGYIVFQSEKIAFDSKGKMFVDSTEITEMKINLSNEGNALFLIHDAERVEKTLMSLFDFSYFKAKKVAEIMGEEGFYQNKNDTSKDSVLKDLDAETRMLLAQKANEIFGLNVELSDNLTEFESKIRQAAWNKASNNNQVNLHFVSEFKKIMSGTQNETNVSDETQNTSTISLK